MIHVLAEAERNIKTVVEGSFYNIVKYIRWLFITITFFVLIKFYLILANLFTGQNLITGFPIIYFLLTYCGSRID